MRLVFEQTCVGTKHLAFRNRHKIKDRGRMKTLTGITTFILIGASTSFASLIPIGLVASTGSGLGAVSTVLTMSSKGNSSNESGCVGAGAGGTTVTGASKCPGSPFTGGDEQAINNVFSNSALGLTDFNNLQLIFNASEPGGDSISLDNFALTAYSSGGVLLQTHLLASPYFIANTLTGIGNAGFGFKLDTTEAGQLNSLLTGGATIYLGAAANASLATGGPETIYFRVNTAGGGGGGGGGSTTPEPGTVLMVSSGLFLLGFSSLLKRRKNTSV
jgi:hypothetical protein